jgi:hypothetical protein
MCRTITTTFTCGHIIFSHTADARLCRNESCIVKDTLLNDTCASCHPPILIAEINRKYDALRHSVIERMRKAETLEEIEECERLLSEAGTARAEELTKAGMMRWTGVVDWGVEEGETGMANVGHPNLRHAKVTLFPRLSPQRSGEVPPESPQGLS